MENQSKKFYEEVLSKIKYYRNDKEIGKDVEFTPTRSHLDFFQECAEQKIKELEDAENRQKQDEAFSKRTGNFMNFFQSTPPKSEDFKIAEEYLKDNVNEFKELLYALECVKCGRITYIYRTNMGSVYCYPTDVELQPSTNDDTKIRCTCGNTVNIY